MRAMAAVMGELRSLFAQPYGATSWAALCEALAPCVDLDRERWRGELAPYLERGLAQWPDADRVAPMAWVLRAAANADAGALKFARIIRLDPRGEEILWGDEAFEALVCSPDFAQIVRIEASGGGFGDRAALALARSHHAGRLSAIDLSQNMLTSQGARYLARSHSLGALRELDLSGNNEIGPPGCASFWEAPQSKRLRVLKLAGCRWDGDIFWEVFRPSVLSQVEVDIAPELEASWARWWYHDNYM